jgi:hypothetical protein
MAIYETGATTGVNDLIDKIRAFAVTNGWTNNSFVAEGAGFRLHLQLSTDVFVNFRSLVAEASQPSGAVITALAMNGSTGYNGSNPWYAQPGAALISGGAPNRPAVGIVGSGAFPTYHLFARSNMIYCVVEYTTGQYQWLGFGKPTKKGTWSGGILVFGARECRGTNDTTSAHSTMCGRSQYITNNADGNPNAFLYAECDGATNWMASDANMVMNPTAAKFFDGFNKLGACNMNSPNSFNGQVILIPIELYMTRQGPGSWTRTTNISIEGYLTDIFMCNMKNLTPGQLLTISSDEYLAFPFRLKTTSGTVNTAGATGWQGFAIKKN